MKLRRPAPLRPSYWGSAPTFLHQHRAMARLSTHRMRLPASLALALLLTAGWLFALRHLGVMWGYALAFGKEALGLPGRIVMVYHPVWEGITLAVPYLDLPAPGPGPFLLLATGTATMAAFGATYYIARERVPLTYFLRTVLLIQATALVYCACSPGGFPYTLADYLRGLTTASLCILTLVPLVLGLTYYILDFSLLQKLFLTACIMGHLAVFIPVQYLTQAALIYHGSLLFMPVLYFLFGIPLNVLIFIALYGWGMSWEGRTVPYYTTEDLARTASTPKPVAQV